MPVLRRFCLKKHHVLTTHTVCKHCWLIRYETDMGPELSTAAADQNFAWICKQHQDLIDSVVIFRTKIIWSGPEFGLVLSGYLNAAQDFCCNYTPSIYAEGYIVFVFLLVCLFVRHILGIFYHKLALKFLTKYSTESIHIWTMGTLEGLLPCHEFWPQGSCPRVRLEVKI